MKLEDADPKQIRELYERFGLAVYQAQCVERQVAILLATCFNPEFSRASPTDRDRALDAEFGKTLGKLISRLSQRIRVSPGLEQRMRRGLELRNLLAHNYFWERAPQSLSPRGRRTMIQELTEYASELKALDATLTNMGRRWMKKVGITEEMREAELKKLRAKGEA